MSTSGTTLFNPDLSETIEEAYERCGIEVRTGYQARTARRSLNYLISELANQGLNLWTYEEADIPLIQGQYIYDLPADCVDLVDQVIRQNPGSQYNQTDLVIPRIALPTYDAIPNKLAQGRPVQVWVNRQTPTPKIYLWQVPNQSGYSFHYWYLRRVQDAGQSGVTTQDIPFRFYEAFTAGLSYHLARKQPEIDQFRLQMLKASYDEALQLAKDEDREKAPLRIVPMAGYLGGGW
jgi:hypothetical protein